MDGESKNAERILILDDISSELKHAAISLVDLIPTAEVTPVDSPEQYRRALAEKDFDVVILNYDISDVQSLENLARLRLRDYEPEVLLVSRCDSPSVVKLIAESRRRYVLRDEHWIDSMTFAVRDMLRVKKLESEMTNIRARLTEANSLLEEKNRRLDEFCSTVAHDIRGPLGGLMLKMEYLLDVYENELDDRGKSILVKSLASANRLTEIVQAMYEFAKIGTKATTLCDLNLAQVVHDVLGDLSFDDKLDIKVGVGELPHIWGNSALLRRVFINLINNAVKYNDKREIKINVACEGFVEKSLARYATITVSDNGPGIADDELKEIFLMFRRGRRGLMEGKRDGLGVGLAVVQRIVELHFGKIDVSSTLGEGTKFILSLPTEKVELLN